MYGEEFLVYNVHSLVHLATDVGGYGTLDACSAFAFENHMQHLKRLIRSGNNPIVQIAKRLGESSAEKLPNKQSGTDISIKKPNNRFILNNSLCCEVVETSNDLDEDGNQMYVSRVYAKPDALFSCLVGTYRVNLRQATMKLVYSQCLENKAIMIDLDPNKIIFMVLTHTAWQFCHLP